MFFGYPANTRKAIDIEKMEYVNPELAVDHIIEFSARLSEHLLITVAVTHKFLQCPIEYCRNLTTQVDFFRIPTKLI